MHKDDKIGKYMQNTSDFIKEIVVGKMIRFCI